LQHGHTDRRPRGARDGTAVAAALGDVDVQYVWRFLRPQDRPDRSQILCESNDPESAAKAAPSPQSLNTS